MYIGKDCIFLRFFTFALCISATFLFPIEAWATGEEDQIVIVLCNVIDLITGTVGKTVSTFVVITVAGGAFMGKITWSNVLLVTVGMSALFGAKDIVLLLTDSSVGICIGISG